MKNSIQLVIVPKIIFAILLMIGMASGLYAQQNGVSINASGAAADNSAGLDISYADKGVLIPRVSLIQTTLPSPVATPAVSLLVFNIATINDVTPGYYYWDGAAWARLSAGGGGGTGSIGCSTTSNNNYTLRGDGLGGWECTSTVRVTGNSSTGSVGINTTPNSSFDLLVNNNVGIGFSPNSSYELSVDGDGHFTDRVGIATTPNTSYTLRVNGNTGIGSSPSSSFTLSVGGDAHVSDGISVGTTSSASSGQVYAISSFRLGSSSTGTGTAVVRTSGGLLVPQSSTVRVKDNIKNLSINKENFLKLRPVSFNLKKSLGGDPDIGFIAEEVALLVPDLVVYGPKRTWIGDTGEVLKNEKGEEVLSPTEVEPYSVRYDKIGVYLVQIVAEQQATIKSQQVQIDALINRIENLETGKMAKAKSSDKAVTAEK